MYRQRAGDRGVHAARAALLTPIVECNGSEIYSSSLVEIFQGFPPVHNAFTKKEVRPRRRGALRPFPVPLSRPFPVRLPC